jgi:hypothetical protein
LRFIAEDVIVFIATTTILVNIDASLLVSMYSIAAYNWVSFIFHLDARQFIADNFIILESTPPLSENKNATLLRVPDYVTSNARVGIIRNSEA